MVNYSAESKKKSKYLENYTENSSDPKRVHCAGCIFIGNYVGKNQYLVQKFLCARHIDEIAEVKQDGTCDMAKSARKWYNQINPIKKLLLEMCEFKFRHR